jgi:DNA-binding CsgD family transcriptional regulator
MLPAFPIVDERALKILVMSIPVRVIYALIRSPPQAREEAPVSPEHRPARGRGRVRCESTRRLIQYFSSPPQQARTPRSIFPDLTDCEREILDLVAAGRNNQEIADELFLSLKTVRNYVSNIFTKLQVADLAQAIVRTRESGLGQDDGLS